MVLGMLINIALARLTPLKYIFLTGHHTLYMAAMLAVILSRGLSDGGGHRGGYSRCDDGHLPGYLAAVYRKITNTDDLALGHFGSIGYLIVLKNNT